MMNYWMVNEDGQWIWMHKWILYGWMHEWKTVNEYECITEY